ncbi:MAG TPA: NapC/NirT family cytochrome c [Candidatus Eisenbacteria bacterium]|jgi:cytochrome c-type protein NapC|nr:NapC/NirT family cytochrome c [Candidatus Eisenbacteria bacterium]
MATPYALIVLFIVFSIVLVSIFVFRPGITATRGGKIMAFLVLFALPLLCFGLGGATEMEHSKSTKFCLSCHIMEPYGQSLRVDDPMHLAAAHFQNHRVLPGEACYTCHTNYAMFGGMKAKFGGLKHIYVYYLTTPPAPQDIKLYEPFNNRECLHCHAGARSFEEGAVHTADPDLLPAIKANKHSCLSSGCHETVHDVKTLKEQKFWKGAG